MTSRNSNALPAKRMADGPCGEQFAGQAVSVMALEFIASGRLSKARVSELVVLLVNDIKGYPAELVEQAIAEHRKVSSFWPSLADLMTHMQPVLDARYRIAERKQREMCALEFVNDDDPPPPTDEQRAKAQKLIDDLKARDAEISKCANHAEPFVFPQPDSVTLDSIHAENQLFRPNSQRYEKENAE